MPHINVYAIEQRTQILPGQPPMVLTREVTLRNGKGRKTVRLQKGKRVVSSVTKRLNFTERKKIGKRRYVKHLYRDVERSLLDKVNANQ